VKADVVVENRVGLIHIRCTGNWTKEYVTPVISKLQSLNCDDVKRVVFDFSLVQHMDYAGVVVISKIRKLYEDQGVEVEHLFLHDSFVDMFRFYEKNRLKTNTYTVKKSNFFQSFGASLASSYRSFLLFIAFAGESTFQMLLIMLRPTLFRFKAMVKQLEEVGLKALPIIGVTSFLVGLVIAYQSSEELVKFGANIFIVEMVSISVFRELAPMIAAIVIAGRSASAFTAEIGTMKITEEIDAMKTMGFNPHRFLVIPRVSALIIAMPLIVFFADAVAIFGGMLIAKTHLSISYTEFLLRMQTEVDMRHFYIGMIKAPFFGFLIAAIGTFRGFQVTGSTDSIGAYTTKSVVNAIFWVIAMNAIISVLLTEVGI
jgi:phospholipid/cholesterol/gamma-HCH transport system permease protein